MPHAALTKRTRLITEVIRTLGDAAARWVAVGITWACIRQREVEASAIQALGARACSCGHGASSIGRATRGDLTRLGLRNAARLGASTPCALRIGTSTLAWALHGEAGTVEANHHAHVFRERDREMPREHGLEFIAPHQAHIQRVLTRCHRQHARQRLRRTKVISRVRIDPRVTHQCGWARVVKERELHDAKLNPWKHIRLQRDFKTGTRRPAGEERKERQGECANPPSRTLNCAHKNSLVASAGPLPRLPTSVSRAFKSAQRHAQEGASARLNCCQDGVEVRLGHWRNREARPLLQDEHSV